jgi:hypothetical protein
LRLKQKLEIEEGGIEGGVAMNIAVFPEGWAFATSNLTVISKTQKNGK